MFVFIGFFGLLFELDILFFKNMFLLVSFFFSFCYEDLWFGGENGG